MNYINQGGERRQGERKIIVLADSNPKVFIKRQSDLHKQRAKEDKEGEKTAAIRLDNGYTATVQVADTKSIPMPQRGNTGIVSPVGHLADDDIKKEGISLRSPLCNFISLSN